MHSKLRGGIQNIPDWCRHIYSSCDNAKHRPPTGQTVNPVIYCYVLRWPHENLQRLRPELWRQQPWLLHHDNAPSHISVLTQQLLAKHKMAVIPRPPYSPDLKPCDFFLFPKIKLKLKGRRSIPLRRSRLNRRECLTLWQKRTSRKRFKHGRDGGTTVYVREGTTSRMIAADRPYGEFYEFYGVSPEYFGLIHVTPTS
jgi:hypothetical protein